MTKDKDEELQDAVEALFLKLLSHDNPQEREDFIQALIHDYGSDLEEQFRALSKSLLETKAKLKDILQ